MPKYSGDEVEVRIVTTDTDATYAAASPVPQVSSVEWHVKQGRKKDPVGLGSRLKTVEETLIDYTGSLERWHSEDIIAGSQTFRQLVGAFQQSNLTPLFIEVKNKTTGKRVRLKKCKGDYDAPAVKPDGYMMDAYDFDFEDIAEV
jgi:hypothetical protein